MRQSWLLLCCLGVMACLVRTAIAQEHPKSEKSENAAVSAGSMATLDNSPKPPAAGATTDERIARLEGEKRFRTNCGRCHQPPHKFPPRVMAAAIRHMRVRAMLTDEDMRLILKYMTQ